MRKLRTHDMMYSKKSVYLTIAIITLCSSAFSQTVNQNWRKDLAESFEQFMACTGSRSEKYQCSSFIGESIAKVYKTNAFFSDKLSRFLHITEISKSIVENGEWNQIGYAYDQKALDKAQDHANANKAVIAVYMTPAGVGHIALILPGKLQYSGSWGFNVPNAASFFFNDSEKSFVDKGLSYAFSKNMIKDVILYARK